MYGILSMITSFLNGDGGAFDSETGGFVGIDPTLNLLFMNLMYVVWLLGIWLSLRIVHKRKLKTLITANDRINWKRIFSSFILYFGLMGVVEVVDFLVFPGHFVWNEFDLQKFLFLFFVVLLLTPIQTTVEELIFRGFLLQWIGKIMTRPVLLGIIMALIFGSLHFSNPEMERSAIWVGLDYVFIGFMLTFLAVKMGSSELSIGAHAANNMFLFWFIGDPQSVGGGIPSLITVVNNDPVISFIMDIILLLVFYLIAVKKFKPSTT
ncbi:CPBP family intramembrane glutamic endopeptidase [Peribacillus loiseleuriae]|uniref:CPBP family intramembrane glutamic endopeptidase n=1 Tax=Peribacillus loiseleuriae TaxID=1679170 RepID=UPI003CFF70C4